MLWGRDPGSQRLNPAEEQHLLLSCYTTVLLLLYKVLLQVLTPRTRPLVPCNAPCHRSCLLVSEAPWPQSTMETGRGMHSACLPCLPTLTHLHNTWCYLTFSDNSTRVYNGFGSFSSLVSSVVPFHSHSTPSFFQQVSPLPLCFHIFWLVWGFCFVWVFLFVCSILCYIVFN